MLIELHRGDGRFAIRAEDVVHVQDGADGGAIVTTNDGTGERTYCVQELYPDVLELVNTTVAGPSSVIDDINENLDSAKAKFNRAAEMMEQLNATLKRIANG